MYLVQVVWLELVILMITYILDMVLDLIEKETFSFGNGFGRNCIIFVGDMSSSVHVDNK